MCRRKKHNPLKQAQLLARNSLKNTAIGFVTGTPSWQFLDTRNHQIQKPKPTIVNLVSNFRHPWSVFIAAFGIDDNQRHYMKADEVVVPYPVFQHELIDTLNTEHARLCKDFNPRHFISAGWIKTPYHKVWTEAEAFQILERLGALDFTPSGERQCNTPGTQ